jgi:DNA polymerase III delta subunit
MAEKKNSLREELAAILKQETPPPFLVVSSSDLVRRERIVDSVLKNFFNEGQLKPETFKGEELRSTEAVQQIEAALSSINLFNPASVVVIKEAQNMPADRAAQLAKLLPSIPEGACLLCSAHNLPSKNKLYSTAKRKNLLLKTIPLKGTELANWIGKELKQSGIKRAPKSVINGIATISNGSLDLAVSIIEHCSLYSDTGEITHKDFEALYPEASEQNEFELIDLLHRGNPLELDIALERLWLNGKNAFMFLGLLTRTYSRYVSIRAMLDAGQPQGKIRHALGMNEWLFNKHFTVAKKRSLARLQSDMAELLRADSLIKNKSLGPNEVIAQLASSLSK